MTSSAEGMRLVLISIHGLIRGHDLELGRDADTGGQILYVLELARNLAERDEVEQVDLVTRRIDDPSVAPDYSQPIEELSAKGRIVRLDCGPPEYLAKEELWDHLESFADNLLAFYRDEQCLPSLVHGHYADAGYVGARVASSLGIPLIFTGHSLGRVKRRRLLASGLDSAEIEARYQIARRIEAEEESLDAADRIVVSTRNETREQYRLYDHYRPEQMRIIPPGTDLTRFRPPDGTAKEAPIYHELSRFLRHPDRPPIVALSRPDERKNISTLVEAYGERRELQEVANLVILAGTREEIREMDEGSARVLENLLLSIDSYDLYGRVAYPKTHRPQDVPDLYRLAALLGGVFVNPALTEPFGLTLLEAAASGLPVVATEDGGPQDILAHCRNGYLVDPLDAPAMASRILQLLRDRPDWNDKSRSGIDGVHRFYSWTAHCDRYLEEVRPLLEQSEPVEAPSISRRTRLFRDRAIFTDIDQNLLGDPEALARLVEVVEEKRSLTSFGIATGRRLDSALRILKKYGVPLPDVLITSVGTSICYAPDMEVDTAWARHIDHLWTPRRILEALEDQEGLELQPSKQRSRFKLSYSYDADKAPPLEEILSTLRQHEQSVNVFLSFGQYLDITPIRASKGFALRWFADHWAVPLERILVAGGSGTDEDMMRGNPLAVVVGNRHHEELSHLTDVDTIYFAEGSHAAGILEAIEYYDFLGNCHPPEAP